jgi:hypothetical protein
MRSGPLAQLAPAELLDCTWALAATSADQLPRTAAKALAKLLQEQLLGVSSSSGRSRRSGSGSGSSSGDGAGLQVAELGARTLAHGISGISLLAPSMGVAAAQQLLSPLVAELVARQQQGRLPHSALIEGHAALCAARAAGAGQQVLEQEQEKLLAAALFAPDTLAQLSGADAAQLLAGLAGGGNGQALLMAADEGEGMSMGMLQQLLQRVESSVLGLQAAAAAAGAGAGTSAAPPGGGGAPALPTLAAATHAAVRLLQADLLRQQPSADVADSIAAAAAAVAAADPTAGQPAPGGSFPAAAASASALAGALVALLLPADAAPDEQLEAAALQLQGSCRMVQDLLGLCSVLGTALPPAQLAFLALVASLHLQGGQVPPDGVIGMVCCFVQLRGVEGVVAEGGAAALAAAAAGQLEARVQHLPARDVCMALVAVAKLGPLTPGLAAAGESREGGLGGGGGAGAWAPGCPLGGGPRLCLL